MQLQRPPVAPSAARLDAAAGVSIARHALPRQQQHHTHRSTRQLLAPGGGGSGSSHSQKATSSRRQLVAVRSYVEPSTTKDWHKLDVKHVVEAQQFGKDAIDVIFAEAERMEKVKPGTPEAKVLDGRLMATLFYEPSTRTRLSFESAFARLGGTVLSTESAGEYSSAAKGETLEDTIRTVEGYADCIVLRHFQAGSAKRAASVSSIPILNAGDGPGQHPTQALLDLYSIKKEIGRLTDFKIGLVGDLLNGRTVHSLAYLLSMYSGVKIYFVAPQVVAMKQEIKDFLTSKGVPWEEVDDLSKVASDVDVLYMTRIQKERFTDMDQYKQARGKYIINADIMKQLHKGAVVLHPLPRVDEIDIEVDPDPRAAYFRQARNGLFIRMALVKQCILGS